MPKLIHFFVLIILSADWTCLSDPIYLRGPALVERNPVLLNSFLPAAMQIIAHCSDLLKYDVKPAGPNPTTTTLRPTPPHSPGIYAPKVPPKLALQKKPYYRDNTIYVNRYKIPIEAVPYLGGNAADFHSTSGTNFWSYFKSTDIAKDLELLGQRPTTLLKKVTRDDDYDFVDEELNVQKFADDYEEASFRNYVIGNKVVPPTQAYVTLLTLYDLLNKESKKLQLNKYGGYTDEILKALVETSTYTSAVQLKIVLTKVVERRDTSDANIINKINQFVEDLNQQESYINEALKYIPPLSFSL